ncbi:MAG: class I SAM-dependent methyltransferase [Nanoarchaeota archaeon]|nr:class I SAM-dependent methyltransferase [Nanoarchaeota archaeon]
MTKKISSDSIERWEPKYKKAFLEKRMRKRNIAINKARIIYFLVGDIIKKSNKIIDLGGGDGSIRKELELMSKKTIIGTDLNAGGLQYSKNFYQCDASDTPFKDEEFDFVISNGLYEHIPKNKQLKSIKEAYRILKKGGYMYFFTCSKYSIIEPHTHLPFLGCIPQPLATLIARVIGGRKVFDVYSPSYDGLIKDLSKYFVVNDITLDLVYKKNNLSISNKRILSKLPRIINKMLLRVSPSIKLLCRKM